MVLVNRWQECDGDGISRADAFVAQINALRARGDSLRSPERDLRGATLSRTDLREVDFSNCDLRWADLSWAQLGEASFSHAHLDDAVMLGADLRSACFNECVGCRTEFGTANLENATFINATLTDAGFAEANLARADLRAANLTRASLRHAVLRDTNAIRAILIEADLKEVRLAGANLESADLSRARLLKIREYTRARWVGVTVFDANFTGAYMARRHIMDENYLFEFQSRSTLHRCAYFLWWFTSDCGRSLTRWTFWVFVVAAAYAGLYHFVEIDFGDYTTPLSPLYFSIVTMTTLGYGDAVPASLAAQVLAVSQALLGYVGLGGLLSILANKMARRSE